MVAIGVAAGAPHWSQGVALSASMGKGYGKDPMKVLQHFKAKWPGTVRIVGFDITTPHLLVRHNVDPPGANGFVEAVMGLPKKLGSTNIRGRQFGFGWHCGPTSTTRVVKC